jgi:hypothetical protein
MSNGEVKRKHVKVKVALGVVTAAVVCVLLAFFVYVGDYNHASEDVWEFAQDYNVEIHEQGSSITIMPSAADVKVGYVFYPGGKVEPTAYLPYLAEIAGSGYYCVLLKPPFNLAIFSVGAAGDAIKAAPDIQKWAVGGHSLGGVAAAGYCADAKPAVKGLVLLAAYPTSDLTQSGMHVLSITASLDGVLNNRAWLDAQKLLPSNTEYLAIEGGNHSQFGRYGTQAGDNEATIPEAEQRGQVSAATVEFLSTL